MSGLVSTDETLLIETSNYNSTVVPLSVDLESPWTSVNGTIMSNEDPNGFNYKNNATAITPLPLKLTNSAPLGNGSWTWDVP